MVTGLLMRPGRKLHVMFAPLLKRFAPSSSLSSQYPIRLLSFSSNQKSGKYQHWATPRSAALLSNGVQSLLRLDAGKDHTKSRLQIDS